MIKTVLIDIDNTLLDFDKCACLAMRAGFGQCGLSFSEGMFDTFTRINNELWSEIEKRTITKQDLYRVRWNRIFAELGISADGEEFEHIFKARLAESAEPVDGAYSLLEYLAPRFTVCAASNGPQHEQESRLARADMTRFLDYIFTSEGIGVPKPEKAFFDGCFARMNGAEKQSAILIGDSQNADIDGGRACGIRTIWYNHHGSDEPSRADYTANSLAEVAAIIEKITETEQAKKNVPEKV